MERGDKIKHILEILKDGTIDFISFWLAVGTSRYGDSAAKIQWRQHKIYWKIKDLLEHGEIPIDERKKFNALLYKLKKENLIEEKRKNGVRYFSITNKGLEKLKNIKQKWHKEQKSKELIMIIFDIPESDRDKRRWLRNTLKQLGFKMLQKSVWIGKNKLPVGFIKELKILKLLKHIEIFEVLKLGTIKV